MDTDELNQLIRQLNTDGDAPASAENAGVPMELIRSEEISAEDSLMGLADSEEGASPLQIYLAEAIRRGATDLLLVPDAPPTIRVNGSLLPMGSELLKSNDAARMLLAFFTPERRERFSQGGAIDGSISLAPLGRIRVNLHRVRRGCAAALRILPRTIPVIAELGLPASLEQLTRLTGGLILVTGPTGCGKSTTLAAFIDTINRREKRHIITIEDPVEYEHPHAESVVEQIEIGTDSPSFADAVRDALRQDPDVLLVGEMRDLETVRTTLTAAETGHLVLTTAHTNDAAQTIHRIVDIFSGEQQMQIRHQVSMALSAVIYQKLIPRTDGRGRVVACEILVANDAVRNHIRKGTLHLLHNEMIVGRKLGMMTFEDSLSRLVRAGVIAEPDARIHALHVEELATYLKD